MCNPVALAATAASVAAAKQVVGFIGQNQAASANTRAANLGYAQTLNELGQRSVQIDEQQSENTVQAMIGRIAAQGKISASAAAMGTDLATTAGESNAAAFGFGRGLSIENLNSQGQRLQLANQQTAAWYARQSQINKVQRPSLLGLGLDLTGTALKGASQALGMGAQLPGLSKDKAAMGSGESASQLDFEGAY